MDQSIPKITRVKTGCLTCRGRKKKCDEQKPICRGCARNYFTCRWPTSTQRTTKSQKRSQCTNSINIRISKSPNSSEHRGGNAFQQWDHFGPSLNSPTNPILSDLDIDLEDLICTRTQHESSPNDSDSTGSQPDPTLLGFLPRAQEPALDIFLQPDDSVPVDETSPIVPFSLGLSSQSTSLCSSNPLVWEKYGEDGFHLLGHYLTRTAISMSGGFKVENPFLSQLMPVAMSNDLIMHLILTQSALHRAVTGPTSPAHNYYNQALTLFRSSIDEYGKAGSPSLLVLGIGALILCFTETARGEKGGAIFKHLTAANNLVSSILDNYLAEVQTGLEDFLVEYCIYATTSSMVSLDPRLTSQLILRESLEAKGAALAEARYVGTLSGCWIELLLMIPRIISFGLNAVTTQNQTTEQSAERFALFATLQSELLTWTPYPNVSADQKFSGLFYQQALLLYLYTAAIGIDSSSNTFRSDLIDATVAKALLFLDSVPPTAQTNTLLGWPIAIVGSCLSEDDGKEFVRNRLNTMLDLIGLGNIREILRVLEIMWEKDVEEAGPWKLYKIMKEHKLSFSFA